jgi:hypothetical protein
VPVSPRLVHFASSGCADQLTYPRLEVWNSMASAERYEASVELLISPAGAATNNDRLLSWVYGSKDGGDSSEIGLASTLYKTCLQTLGLVSKQYVASKRMSRGKKARIIECHSRLCLFGDELLKDGALEHCLKVDHEVREETIRVLYHLGKTLLKGPPPCFFFQPRTDDRQIFRSRRSYTSHTRSCPLQ